MSKAKELLIKAAHDLGLHACGAAPALFPPLLKEKLEKAGPIPFAPADTEKRLHPENLLPGASSFFVLLFPYKAEEERKANIALYARPKDYHIINHRYMEKIIQTVQEEFPEARFYALTDTSPMVDRWLAWSAGLGFFGKNHCLIHPLYGSFVTIGAILTTLELEPDQPLSLSCGDCSLCERACPGKVIGREPFRPSRCKSCITQKKEDLTDGEIEILKKTSLIFGCDECQKCCPFNRKAPLSPIPEIHENRISCLSGEELESLSNRGFDRKYKEYAFAWRGKKVLLRNWHIIHDK